MIKANKQILESIDRLSVLFFSASWCEPCKKVKPYIEMLRLTDENYSTKVNIYYIDVDLEGISLINDLEIKSIPSLYIYDPNSKLEKGKVISGSDINKIKTHLLDNKIKVEDVLDFGDDFK